MINYSLRKEIKIVNVVCTANIKQKVDIKSFNEYDSLNSDLSLYKCGYVKDSKMLGRVTVFGNGKMISVGTKSPKQSHIELRKAVNIMHEYNLIKKCKIKPEIRNMVGVVDFKHMIDLVKIATISKKSIYEPDRFAGLTYKIQKNITFLIFASGKVIIVGSKSFEDINMAYFELVQIIKEVNKKPHKNTKLK